MRSCHQAAALLLLGYGCLSRARAQEVQREDAQEVEAYYPTRGLSVDNGENDIAVGGIWHDTDARLYVAIQTTGFLGSYTNFGEKGTNDIFIEALDADLVSEDSLQFGSDGDDLVTAIAYDEGVQNDFVIVGSTESVYDHLFETQTNSTGALDWFIATMNSDLEITGSYVSGWGEDQQATAVVVDPEEAGSYYVAGWTWGDYFDTNAGDDNDEESIGYDAWVVKINSLDIEDDFVWGLQFGTAAYDEPSAIVADDTKVYVVGTIRDDSDVLSAAEEAQTQSIFVVACDVSDGEVIWEMDETALGILTDASQAHGAVLNERGTELFVSGNTQGALPNYDGEIPESDELFVMSIDTDDGSVNWVWQSQMNATAFGTGGVVMADDGVSPIVSGIAFGNQFNLTFTYWEDGSGDMVAAKIDPDNLDDPDTLGVAKYFVASAGSSETREDPFALVKDPDVVDGVFMIGGQDGDFGDEDAEIEPDPNSDENLSNFLVLKIQLEDLLSSEGSSTSGSSTSPMIAGIVSAVGGAALIAVALLIKRRRDAKQKAAVAQQQLPRAMALPPPPPRPANDDDNIEQGPDHTAQLPSYGAALGLGSSGGETSSPPPSMPEADGGGATFQAPPPPAILSGVAQPSNDRDAAGLRAGTAAGTTTKADGHSAAETSTTTDTTSTATNSTAERAELAEFHRRQVAAAAGATSSVASGPRSEEASGGGGGAEAGTPSTGSGRQSSSVDIGLGQAVLAAAQELALSCQVPGISEAAAVLVIMANLFTDSREGDKASDSRLRQCRSIALRRAEKVVGKGGDTTGETAGVLIEDVHDAIFDLVELIKTFQSKNKLSKMLLSTLFKRRQEELDAVVDRAIMRLQLGLQLQVGHDMSSVRRGMASVEDDVSAIMDGVKAVEEGMLLYRQTPIAAATSEAVAEARRIKRQRKLDQVEIPEDQVWISDELLGRGGFGDVFLAEYNTRNAAAKVLHVIHDLGKPGEHEVIDAQSGGQSNLECEKSQRKAFLRELEAMIRLRSPHTVGVFGAITSQPDRLVLVMELLPGGDLRTLLKNSEQPLPEEQSRLIISDICAGMDFLHGKETVHGDLKSANILLDGTGRGKIGDFGTSRWSHHTNSTGLATHTKGGQNTQMSLAWSAPEVLGASGSTFASDVYSFGIVAWEVLSRELPWAGVTHPREVYIRVVLNDLRPDIPVNAPADLANMVRACWAGEPEARPTFSTIMARINSHGWGE